MRKLTVLFIVVGCIAGWFSTVGASSAKKVKIAGVIWENSLDDAKIRAAREKKPVLHLQMFGRLDDAYC